MVFVATRPPQRGGAALETIQCLLEIIKRVSNLASQRQLRVSCRARVRAIPERAPAKDENEAPGIEVAGLLLPAECGHPLRPKRVPRFGAFQQSTEPPERTAESASPLRPLPSRSEQEWSRSSAALPRCGRGPGVRSVARVAFARARDVAAVVDASHSRLRAPADTECRTGWTGLCPGNEE